ncbi:hypothetical protein NM688_g5385 [Phlebia brevispora]|uniref:Uncharacterized protein n=1 Tax=Phlebia brevispora TaxID=194682 RepID=A0ACC1SVW7_9APHY|nr:hypothetical protein NM688_g5385 [Phlebia brevispora]
MADTLTSATLPAVALATILVAIFLNHIFKKPRLPLPPGPKGLPIIGNLLDMPRRKEHLTFAKWRKTYGDIVYLNVLGSDMVILNSPKLAAEMMDKKGTVYSNRPHIEFGGEMVGYNKVLVLIPYGDRHRENRRFLHHVIGSRSQVKKRFDPLMEKEHHKFLRHVLHDPDHVQWHIRNLAGGIILNMAYGYEPQERDDPYVKLVEQVSREFSLSFAPGTFLVDVFPLLRYVPSWFPGGGFKKTAAQWRKNFEDAANFPFELVKRRMEDGSNVPNFTSELLEKHKAEGDKESDIKWAAKSLYLGMSQIFLQLPKLLNPWYYVLLGGADTSVSAVYSFFLAMTLYPDVQRKAQEEIDKVVGTDRLPTSADRDALPYVDALVTEVLRWITIAPIGAPHCVAEDDEHAGYHIPKGAKILPNIWAFLHDPEVYEDPFEFNPSRFIPQEGKPAAPDAREYCFGFGRRICPGVHLADASIWLSCAWSLAVFNISKKVEDGKIVEPVVDSTDGAINHPLPFKCTIKPRSAKAESLILSED